MSGVGGVNDASLESSKSGRGMVWGDGRVFLDAGMETVIIVAWLAVGDIMQMLLRGWDNQKKQQAKTYSAMHNTRDKGECIKPERLVLSRNSATDMRSGSDRTGSMASPHRLVENTKDSSRGTLLGLRPALVQVHRFEALLQSLNRGTRTCRTLERRGFAPRDE